jgi:signal transduction histidine kinase
VPADDPARLHRLSLRQLIWICIGTIIAVYVLSAGASIGGRIIVSRTVADLSGHMLPMQDDAFALGRAYVDQETGLRGFLLTGHPVSLEPYNSGQNAAKRLIPSLRGSIEDGDNVTQDLLSSVEVAANTWVTEAAEPQVAAREAGPLPPGELESVTLVGKRLFDQLREKFRALQARTAELIRDQLDRVSEAQKLANTIQVIAVSLLAVVIVATVIALQRTLTRPVNKLLLDVHSVAEGNYDQPIGRRGPREIASIADAAETMRDNLHSSTTRLVDAERRDEQTRLASDLHDRTIQRVFALGLGLSSAASRPGRPDLSPLITETDEIIRDLRDVIFNLHRATDSSTVDLAGLRSAIIDAVESSSPGLKFAPTVELEGPLEESTADPRLQATILAVLRESLANIARHAQATAATVRVSAHGDELCLCIQDNGIGISPDDVLGQGRENIRRRAEQLGGSAQIRNVEPNGTLVEWRIPLSPGRPPETS